MGWGPLTWTLVVLGALFALFVIEIVYLSAVLAWEDQKTLGTAYYGLPPDARRRFKRALRRHARLLFPVLRLTSRFSSFDFRKVSFRHRDIAGPRGTCSPESFAAADDYEPRPEDVFVVTQMKCGTTWMQHLVYQVVCRGAGDLVESGRTLYAVSPWLEARKSVAVGDAPALGAERPTRIIKTHLPAQLCPFSPDARYIYVARHPVSCFASCVDFIAANVGAMAPALDATEAWFRSDELMWWGTWPRHVAGWWRRAQEESNVLFVHFEEMKRDLPAVARRVAAFLDVEPLTEEEMGEVVRKCGFEYMRDNHDAFEMHPPHILAVDAELFVRGTTDRHREVVPEVRHRIAAWCAAAMEVEGSGYPLASVYPDVAEAAAGQEAAGGVAAPAAPHVDEVDPGP